MKIAQIQEASYHNQQHKWYILSDEGDYKVVIGPFKTHEDAGNYANDLEEKYSHMRGNHVPVVLNLEPIERMTPDAFTKAISDHHRWLNED